MVLIAALQEEIVQAKKRFCQNSFKFVEWTLWRNTFLDLDVK